MIHILEVTFIEYGKFVKEQKLIYRIGKLVCSHNHVIELQNPTIRFEGFCKLFQIPFSCTRFKKHQTQTQFAVEANQYTVNNSSTEGLESAHE